MPYEEALKEANELMRRGMAKPVRFQRSDLNPEIYRIVVPGDSGYRKAKLELKYVDSSKIKDGKVIM